MNRRKIVSGISLIVVLSTASMLMFAVNIRPVKAWGKSYNAAVVDDYHGSAVGYLYPSDYPDQTFSTLSGSQVSAETLTYYDTVILFMFNPTLLTAIQKAAINDWVYTGGKLIIWDSDQVPPGSPWDYTWLPYPFTTSVPGQTGQTGKGLEVIEENELSSSDPSSPYYIDTAVLNSQTDAVGDANVLTAYSPAWHIDMMATNVLGETGPAHVYAAHGSGLIIYSALDWDYAGYNISSGEWIKKMLKQELECSYLPFGAPTVPGEVGLIVTVTPKQEGPYYVGDTIEFEVTVTNPTDVTGINIVAYNVLFTVVPPDEIETASVCYLLGDIAPGESKSNSFEATAKKPRKNVGLIVNAYGEDRLLGILIAGSGKYTLSLFEPETPKPDWSFAIITDLHIGYGHEIGDWDSDGFDVEIDYGSKGWYDDKPEPQQCNYGVTDQLANTIETIIAHRDLYNIKFVVVLGDISDTAERSEFFKAREILNRLNDYNIPYIPILGNHDVWPYTQDIGKHRWWHSPQDLENIGYRDHYASIARSAIGDRIFKEIFWGESNEPNEGLIRELFGNSWEFTYDQRVQLGGALLGEGCRYKFLLQDEGGNKFYTGGKKELLSRIGDYYLMNYGFTFGGITFVCLDMVPRLGDDINPAHGSALPGAEKGGLSTNHENTLDFSRDYYRTHLSETSVFFSHYAPTLVTLHDILYGDKHEKVYWFAGHHHYHWNYSDVEHHIYEVVTEDVAGIPFALLGRPIEEWMGGERNGETIRIVQVNGDEIDFETTLKPAKQPRIQFDPVPGFTYSFASHPEPNKEITFTAHFTTYYGFKTSFEWDFGDGNSGSGFLVTHTYSQEGEYYVTLTVTTKNLITGEETSQRVTGPVTVKSKHVISPLPPDLSATSLITGEDLTEVPQNVWQPVLITRIASENIPVAEFGVHFEEATENIDLSTLVADVDDEEGRSVIYMPSWPEEIDECKLLFIPSTGTGAAYICSDASSLEEVSLENADVIINVGETKDGITVTTTFYNGMEYYLVSGVTGTGGGEMSWDYVFSDVYGRGTILKINTALNLFQFIAPTEDYGIREATYMKVHGRTIAIRHEDNELRLITLTVDTKLDFCVTIAWDVETRTKYFLLDKVGIE